MPSRTSSNGATPTPTPTPQQPASKRFELPVLEFKFGSLTEGTNIPPPLPSPVEEEPPAAKEERKNGEGGADSNGNSAAATTAANTAKAGTKRPADDSPISPVSPTLSNRQGSIRRLFSRNLLNASYANGEPHNHDGAAAHHSAANGGGVDGRPTSQSNGSISSKRGSGWFRRLRGADAGSGGSGKRSSAIYENGAAAPAPGSASASAAAANKKPAGPPPPMIPELRDLEAKVDQQETSFGPDLFKDIK